MGRQIVYTGKDWAIWSTVADGFVREKLQTLSDVAQAVEEDCQRAYGTATPVVWRQDLTCRCDGSSYGEERKGELQFLNGVNVSFIKHTDPTATIVSQEQACKLIALDAMAEALEMQLAREAGDRSYEELVAVEERAHPR